MERKEPVMAPSVSALEERIPLTWREVNELASVTAASETPAPVAEKPAVGPVSAEPAAVQENRALTEEEIAALCDHLMPVLEKTIRRGALADARDDATQRTHARALRPRPFDSTDDPSGA